MSTHRRSSLLLQPNTFVEFQQIREGAGVSTPNLAATLLVR